MAKLPEYPKHGVRLRLKGKIQFTSDRGVIVAKVWPRKRPGKGTPAQEQVKTDFKKLVEAQKNISALDKEGAQRLALDSGYTWRDVVSRAMTGRLIEWSFLTPEANPLPTADELLSQLGTDDGMLIVNIDGTWLALPIGLDSQALIVDPITHRPKWTDLPDTGINQLTGDATAGPGSGSVALTLASTGITPGSYTFAGFTVDAKGRLTAASSGSPPAYINQLTGDATAGPGSGSVALTLASTGVTPGTYPYATITVDAKGRATGISSNSAPSVATPVFHPGYLSGRYYTSPLAQVFNNQVPTANRIYLAPFYISEPKTFTRAAVYCGSGVALGEVTLGIYSNTNANPDTLLQTLGTLPMTTSGAKELTGLTITLNAGWYWMAVATNSAAWIQGFTTSAGMANFLGHDPNLSAGGVVTGVVATRTYTSGTLPTNIPSGADTVGGMPLLFLRL